MANNVVIDSCLAAESSAVVFNKGLNYKNPYTTCVA